MDQKAGNILASFLTLKNAVKVYHFQTPNYARHKSSDKLFAKLTDKIDQFMEVLQGSWKVRIRLVEGTSIPLSNMDNNSMIRVLEEFSSWLIDDLPSYLRREDNDLLSIRDEILGDINRTLYLFTFK